MVLLQNQKQIRQIKFKQSKLQKMLGKRKSQSAGSTKKPHAVIPRKRSTPRQELKMFPTNATSSLTALTYVDLSISEVAQGNDYTNQNRQKITPVGLWLKESFIPSNTYANMLFHKVVFIDWAYQSVAHGYADIFYNTSPMTTKNYQNTKRIQIIKDNFITISNYLGANEQHRSFINDKYINLTKYYSQANRTQIQYSGTTRGSVSTGAIFITLLYNKAITYSSTTNVGYQMFAGLTYLDT